ncbi:MAG TPA: hypothetical protein DDZ53_05430 [Firmicutes bacterium]|nr:hypothetical protein [Bacillota bacterium]
MEQLRRRMNVKLLAALLVTLLAFTTVACQPAFKYTKAPEDDMQYLLNMYDHEQMMSWIQDLTSEEYSGREACTEYEDLTGDYIIELLQSFGLEPWREAGFTDYRHAFDAHKTQPAENIIAVLPGKSSEKYLLIGAHYDHLGVTDGILYPGADDNAVGAGAVLELARIFSQSELTPDISIVFVLFSAEELGLVGSQALVKHLERQKLQEQVVLLNLDVIAGASGDTLVVYDSGYKGNKTWAKIAEQEAAASGVKARIDNRLAGGVDSMAFTMRNLPAITLVWGDLREEHPHIHQPTDTFENLNSEIVEAATKAAIRIAWVFANQ